MKNKKYFICAILGAVADLVTTVIALSLGAVEINPLGVFGGMFLKIIIIASFALLIKQRNFVRVCFLVPSLIWFLCALNNILVINELR